MLFAAEKLGLPFPPPYLGLVGKKKPLTGVNYASASCGILDETGKRLVIKLPKPITQIGVHEPADKAA